MSSPKDGAAVRFPPPLIPLACILAGIVAQLLWPITLDLFPGAPLRFWLGGGLVVAVILVLVVWPAILFRRTGQVPEPWEPTTEIVLNGPYRVSRNPMYLAMTLTCVGVGIALANLWVLVLTPICAIGLFFFAIRHEEIYLEAKFGEGYLSYKRRVRRWI